MKKVAILLSLAVFLTGSCEKREIASQAPNVSFTPCRQSNLKSSELSGKADVEFTDKGVQITYYNFEVTCDFTAVDVIHTFTNGVLNITQQGFPNQADCVCHTDVSYTIDGISQNEVNVIFINGEQVYCHNSQGENSLVGKWGFVDRDGVTLEITESEIMLLPVVPNPTPMETRTYSWVSSDTIEITQRIVWSIGATRNKVIFHTPDRVTIKNWFIGSSESDAPIYADVTIERIMDDTANPLVIKAVDVEKGYDRIATVKATVSGHEVASAVYKNNGFELTIPAIIPSEYLRSPSEDVMSNGIVISNKQAKIGTLSIDAYDNRGEFIGGFSLMNGGHGAVYVYADRSFTETGNNSAGMEFDCSYKKGWNIRYYLPIGNNGKCTTQPIEKELKWHFGELLICIYPPPPKP